MVPASDQNETIVRQFVKALNEGRPEAVDQFIDRNFYNHSPAEGEETAPQALQPLVTDLLSAFPDLQIQVSDFAVDGELLTFRMTMAGTHAGVLWGSPGTGRRIEWEARMTARFSNGKFAFEWSDLPLRSLLTVLGQAGLIPAREDMDKPHEEPVSLPELLLKLLFTGQVAEKECGHLEAIRFVEPQTEVCQECVELGDVWPALRMCLICGYVGCCDTSKNKHMKQHYEQTGHPLFRSIRLQESWLWCYEDDAFLSGRHLAALRSG